LKSKTEWEVYCRSGKKPEYIPANPASAYANSGWIRYGDWLGTGSFATHLRQYREFPKARTFVRGLGLKSQIEWQSYCRSGKKPEDIPASPERKYAGSGWIGYGDWLGNGAVSNQMRQYRDHPKARAFVRGLGLKSQAEWIDYCKSGKKPEDIPANPHRKYAGSGWIGYGDWLGTGRVKKRNFRPFIPARAFVRGLGLKSQAEWREYCKSGKKPEDIPSNPNHKYAGSGWIGYGDWLGYARSERGSATRSMKVTGEAPAPLDASP
jgi:hypothetical protein